ncbi:hypothetical protein ACFQJD_12330 [Haloplanus sp. GCM10025708]|uniref:hypothetical protein n=1 Tax=Haloferacaceae TaxID=1644056 RepID=UPI0036222214
MAQSRELRVSRTTAVPADARVRHFDELDDDSQQYLAAVESGETPAAMPTGLASGDVVVYTDYFRIH